MQSESQIDEMEQENDNVSDNENNLDQPVEHENDEELYNENQYQNDQVQTYNED